MEGASRFINRVFRMVHQHLDCSADSRPVAAARLDDLSRQLHRKTHQTIRRVTESIESNFHFNTAISGVMELVNTAVSVLADGARIDRAVLRRTLETDSPCSSPWSPIFPRSCGS